MIYMFCFFCKKSLNWKYQRVQTFLTKKKQTMHVIFHIYKSLKIPNGSPPRYNWNIVESGVKHYKPTNGFIRSRISKDKQYDDQKKKGQTMIYTWVQPRDVRVTRSLVLCVCFVYRLSFCPFSFGHFVLLRILITSLVSSNSSRQYWSF